MLSNTCSSLRIVFSIHNHLLDPHHNFSFQFRIEIKWSGFLFYLPSNLDLPNYTCLIIPSPNIKLINSIIAKLTVAANGVHQCVRPVKLELNYMSVMDNAFVNGKPNWYNKCIHNKVTHLYSARKCSMNSLN